MWTYIHYRVSTFSVIIISTIKISTYLLRLVQIENNADLNSTHLVRFWSKKRIKFRVRHPLVQWQNLVSRLDFVWKEVSAMFLFKIAVSTRVCLKYGLNTALSGRGLKLLRWLI